MKQKIIIYGIEIITNALFSKVCQIYTPICFVDHKGVCNKETLYGLPVKVFDEAIVAHPKCKLLVLVSHYEKHKEIDWMLQNGIQIEQIIGIQGKEEERWGCAYLGEYVGLWNGELRHCCSLANTYHLPIRSYYRHSGAETYHAFKADTSEIIKYIQDDPIREKYCGTCRLLRYGKWVPGKTLDKINIGVESSCNYRCIYCGEDSGPYGGTTLDDGTSINSALEMIKYCKDSNILDEFAYFFISCGEPALHPKINEIVELVSDYRCTFATNASMYSEQIASILQKGMSRLRVSIDAGTPETYAEIRGVSKEFYKKVHTNLQRYAQFGKKCVELQYIVMPGINTDEENINGFCQFAQDICGSVLITRDRNQVVEIDNMTARAVTRLRQKLEDTEIKTRIFGEAVCAFSEDEYKRLNGSGII